VQILASEGKYYRKYNKERKREKTNHGVRRGRSVYRLPAGCAFTSFKKSAAETWLRLRLLVGCSVSMKVKGEYMSLAKFNKKIKNKKK
jgi:hypothetical protein